MAHSPCPLPSQQSNNESDSDQSHSQYLSSGSSSNSSVSSNSSQTSLPHVLSVTPTSQQHEPPPTAHYRCISTLKGHSSHVFSLSLAGKHLYGGFSDGKIHHWIQNPSTSSLEKLAAAQGESAVKSLLVSDDKLFTAHQDHKIRVWKIENAGAKRITTLPTFCDRVSTLFWAKNYVTVRRHKKSTWVRHVDAVSALAVSKDGSRLYSASWDRTLKVWRTSDFKCLESLGKAHDDAINAVALSEDGVVYTGSADKKIKAWMKKGEEKHEVAAVLEKHNSAVNALALSSDGSVLYSGACDRSIVVWERSEDGDMAAARRLRGHSKAILCLAVVLDLLCSGSADRTVRVWRRGEGRSYCCMAVLEGHFGPVKCLAGGVDGGDNADTESGSGGSYMVYSGSLDCDIKVWRLWVPFL